MACSLQLGYSQVEKKESPDTQSELSPVQRLDDRAFEGQSSIKREHSPGAIHNSSQEGIKVIRTGILSSPESKSVLKPNKEAEFISVDGLEVKFQIPEIASKSQSPGCATPIPYVIDPQAKVPGCPPVVPCDDPANRDASIPQASDPFKFIKLRWTVVQDASGAPSNINQFNVNDLMQELNNDFAAYHIEFCADPATFVSNTTYYNLNIASEDAGLKTAFGANFNNEINIYVVNDITNPNAGGYARFPYDPFGGTNLRGGVVMGRTNSVLGTHTLAHELGHTFGLHHTFHGVDEVAVCSSCYEQVGAPSGAPAIGDTDGDLCSDTNPHPTNAFNCFDPAGSNFCDSDPWNNTPVDNHMSYSFCSSTFSPQQAGRMHCMIDTYLSSWVIYGGVTCASLPPIPDFVGTPTTWQAPVDVIFIDQSVPAATITNWTWDFDVMGLGGVTPATFVGQNPPLINYANPGMYTVSLTVTNANGSQTETKTDYIVLSAPAGICDTLDLYWTTPTSLPTIYGGLAPGEHILMVPDLVNSPGTGIKGAYEQYITPPGATVGAVLVGLGELDDANDNMVFQISIYDDDGFGLPGALLGGRAGISPTTLGVPLSGFNLFSEYWIPFFNEVTPTTATFHVGIEVFPGDLSDELVLVASSAAMGQGQGNGLNHIWSTGYGYENLIGVYGLDVDLDLIPMLGGYNPLPVIDGFTQDVRCDTTYVLLADTAYYSVPVSWEFLFGDGDIYNSTTDPQFLLKTYLQAGPDIVLVTAVNSCGRVGQTAWSIPYNFLETPNAEFDKDLANASCYGPPGITFTSSTLGMADYFWDFGDGNSVSTGAVNGVSHIYTSPGTYNVTLTTTSGGYQPASTIYSEDFEAGIPVGPGGFVLANQDGLTSQYPPFTAQAWLGADFDGDGSSEAISTSWYNPAGTSDDWLITPAIALGPNSSLFWDAQAWDTFYPDGYEVRISNTTQTVAACLANPPLFTIANENAVRTPRNLNLAGAGYANQTVYIAFRNNSDDQNLLFIDNILVGETALGCDNVEQKLAFVETIDCTVVPPTAHFSADISGGCEGVAIQFEDLSTGPDPATSWLWDFGDGTFSTSQNLSHTYLTAGYFEVTFIAYNDGGSDTARVFIDVALCTVLPIDLLYYRGEDMGTYNQLSWATASEIASDYFELFRINNGVEQHLTTMDAAGYSSQEHVYGWKDHNAPPGQNYYRLDQYDIDGSLSFSQTILIDDLNESTGQTIRIAPNPSNDIVTVFLQDEARIRLDVLNAMGQVIYSMDESVVSSSFEIELSSWAPGTYQFKFQTGRRIEIHRVVVY